MAGTSQALTANGQTITLAGWANVLTTPNGAVTGIIMPLGTGNGQAYVLHNNSANSITFAASGTSNVADGTSCSINAYKCLTLKWSGDASLWFHDGAEASGSETNLTLSGLLFESATDTITAHSGGGQSSAVALTTEVNRVTVAAAAGDSVALPTSVAGLTILIINHGANSIGVYGAGTDQIDDVATATGVSQMVGSMVLYTCTTVGKWYSEGLGTGYSGSLQTFSFKDAMSANSGGVQSGATAVTTMIARFTTVGGSGYSCVLPTAAAGLNIIVINAGANAMNVFPAGSDQINALGASNAYSLPAGGVVEFFSTVTTQWHSVFTPAITTGTGNAVLSTAPTLTDLINANVKRVTTEVDVTSSTALVAITGLSIPLTAAGVYRVRAHLPVTSGASGGVKVSLDTSDTLTLTSSDITAFVFNTAASPVVVHTTSGLATGLGATQVAISVVIEAVLVVNAAGTLVVKGAQNASNGTATSFYVSGSLEATRIA